MRNFNQSNNHTNQQKYVGVILDGTPICKIHCQKTWQNVTTRICLEVVGVLILTCKKYRHRHQLDSWSLQDARIQLRILRSSNNYLWKVATESRLKTRKGVFASNWASRWLSSGVIWTRASRGLIPRQCLYHILTEVVPVKFNLISWGIKAAEDYKCICWEAHLTTCQNWLNTWHKMANGMLTTMLLTPLDFG